MRLPLVCRGRTMTLSGSYLSGGSGKHLPSNNLIVKLWSTVMFGGGGGGGPGDLVLGPMWYSNLRGSVLPGLLALAELAGDPGCCRSGDCCRTDVALTAFALDSMMLAMVTSFGSGVALTESLADELLDGGAALYGIGRPGAGTTGGAL